jgi:uncharacterized protein
MPELIVGNTPRGEDYFGQEALIENLWSRLERDNVLIEAPRRFGKTGAMYRLLDEPRRSFHPLYIDVEHIESAGDFMVELVAKLHRQRRFIRVFTALQEQGSRLGNFLRSLPESIDVGGVKIEIREKTDIPQQWRSYGEKLMSLLAKEEPPLLLLIDEFAIMVDHIARKNRAEVEQFLRWFRAARIAPDTRTRFVISGSINLTFTLAGLGLADTVNDLSVIRLKPFPPETARRFVQAIFTAHRLELSPEVQDSILERVGAPIPYLLAVLLTAILDRQRATHGDVSTEMVEAAFEEDLLGGATSATFHHYRSRIDQYYPGVEGRAAKAILGVLSRAAEPVSGNTLYQIFLKTGNLQHTPEVQEDFMRLMHKLDNDFYVIAQDETYTFFSRVLQLWWKTHYGFQGE